MVNPQTDSLEPKVASHNIDNVLSDGDLNQDQRLLHQHVGKTLDQHTELKRMRERHFMETAATLTDEQKSKDAKVQAEAAKPKTKEVEAINLDTVIRQVESACVDACFRQDQAGEHLIVENETMLKNTQQLALPSPSTTDPNLGVILMEL